MAKQKNRKYLCWLFSSKKTVTIKLYLSENFTFQNLLKNRKLLPAEKLETSWLLTKNLKESYYHISADSFIKNNIAYDFRVEISFISKWTIFWFQKNSIQILWIFSRKKCIFVRLRVKVFVSQESVQTEVTVTI